MKKDIGIDPLTGEYFEKTRSNQIHLTPEHRKKFHNENAKAVRHKIAEVQRGLLNNRKILLKALGEKNEFLCSYEHLARLGINDNFFTGTSNNGTTIIIYEFELTKENEKIKIKRRN